VLNLIITHTVGRVHFLRERNNNNGHLRKVVEKSPNSLLRNLAGRRKKGTRRFPDEVLKMCVAAMELVLRRPADKSVICNAAKIAPPRVLAAHMPNLKLSYFYRVPKKRHHRIMETCARRKHLVSHSKRFNDAEKLRLESNVLRRIHVDVDFQ